MVAAYPPPADYKFGPDGYANHIVKVKQAVRIPVIASLNGHTGESWLKFARIIEQAGADALEFNFYDVATDAHGAVGGARRAPRQRGDGT